MSVCILPLYNSRIPDKNHLVWESYETVCNASAAFVIRDGRRLTGRLWLVRQETQFGLADKIEAAR
ncbi:MAG: hypothetical protein ACYS32_17050, partial [Planctomycetota bacterium]